MTYEQILAEVQGVSDVELECRSAWCDAAVAYFVAAIRKLTF